MTLPPGTKIKTTQSNDSEDWQLGPQQKQLWGEPGMIIGHHDSHGLVYCVAHFRSGINSRIAHYEPGEFDVLSIPIKLEETE